MLFMKKNKNALSWQVPVIASCIIFITGATAVFSNTAFLMLILGSIMSLFTGSVMCFAITKITSDVDYSERGKAFGLIYAVGGVGTLLLSLPNGGNALAERYMLIVYLVIAALSVVAGYFLYREKSDALFSKEEYMDPVKIKLEKKDAVLLCLIFMFFVLSNIGLHFKIAGTEEFESAIISRAFYAIGLIIAGIITDKSRRYGALCAFLALGFGLLSPALQISAGTAVLVQAIAYIFLGFPALYRMVIFSDEAEKNHSKLPIATLGVAAALLGQAAGTFLGIYLERNMTVLVCVMLFLYILTGGVFFNFLSMVYPHHVKEDNLSVDERKELMFEQYVSDKGLNTRQAQVLKCILNGSSNGEIAKSLFVSESTVKYHVTNLLQATSCHNRQELIDDFRNHYLKF